MNKVFIRLYHRFRSFELWKKIAVIFSVALPVILLVMVFGFYLLVLSGVFGRIPTKTKLRSIQHSTGSEVYSSDSVMLGKYFVQDRTNVSFEELPQNLKQALIATEDARFYEHDGLDERSMLRVLVKSIAMGDESAGGGSTLSQQLAKNLFPRMDHGILSMPVNKMREIIIARRLEKTYAKDELLTLYLNTVSFGENVFGIEAAAIRFFNTSTDELRPEQSAVLVGMLKATHTYNPRLFPERSAGRRNLVFSQMEKYGFLAARAADSLQQLELTINYTRLNQNRGQATYFREHLRGWLDSWLQSYEGEEGMTYDLYTDGLKVYTTIDAKLQLYAEQAMTEHMAKLQQQFDSHWGSTKPWASNPKVLEHAVRYSLVYTQLQQQGKSHEEILEAMAVKEKAKIFTYQGEKERNMSAMEQVEYYLSFINAGLLAMEPQNGEIRAWVGGINHKYFKYDHVNRRTKRQVGSTFKPIVYATAIENGVSPCTFFSAQRERYLDYENWSPGNSDDNYKGNYSMAGGLMKSINTISVKVLKDAGIDSTIAMARRLGIDSEIPRVPSIALGTPELSLIELVAAYSSFANNGESVQPVYILRIEDRDGKVLADFTKGRPEIRQAMRPETAAVMIEMMKGVVNKGTASRLKNTYGLRNEIAGKTGTTQSQADGWFVGITPQLVTGVWVGADNPGIRFRTTSLGQGSSTALPIFAKFMQRINRDKDFREISKAKFAPLSPQLANGLNCPTYREDKASGFFISLFSRPKEEVASTYFDRGKLKQTYGNTDENANQQSDNRARDRRRDSDGEKKTLGEKLKGLFKKKK